MRLRSLVLVVASGAAVLLGSYAASLVPAEAWIPDPTAKLELVDQLINTPGKQDEALEMLDRLQKGKSVPERAVRERRVRILGKARKPAATEEDLRWLLRANPGDRTYAVALANILAERGHSVESREVFERLLAVAPSDADYRLYAAQMQGWGDFSRAIEILEKQIAKHGPTIPLLLELAAAQRGAQRFDASRASYRTSLRLEPKNLQAVDGLAVTYLVSKDYVSAVDAANYALAILPEHPEALSIRAEAYYHLGDSQAAAADYSALAARGDAAGWIGLGRIALRNNQPDEAISYFGRALRADAASALFYESLARGEHPPQYPALLPATAPNLSRWASLLQQEGYHAAAVSIYQRAMAADPRFFAALLGYAEAAAAAGDYAAALDGMERMRAAAPENYKLDLTRARILSWSRNYRESVAAYDEMIAREPANPTLRRELARVLTWAKKMSSAMRAYATIWERPVDAEIESTLPADVTAELAGRVTDRSPYGVYEALAASEWADTYREALEIYRGEYETQKAAWLESRAKNATWNQRHIRAEKMLTQLSSFEPGNQEALFDLAQTQAAQGMSLRAMGTYESLLVLDPNHQIASIALARERHLARPAVSVGVLFLDEDGSDRSAEIRRYRVQTSFEIPIHRQFYFRLSAYQWIEQPERGASTTYYAFGPGIEIGGVINKYLRANGSFVYKNYTAQGIKDTLSGTASLTFNAWDYATITAGYERADVIHNEYGILQGTQADSLVVNAKSQINHWLDMRATGAWRFYNDNNSGVEALLTVGVLLLDHPTTLRLSGGVEYRNTSHLSESVFRDGQLADVVHPYWTPQNYLRGIMALEWKQDLSKQFFANAEAHWYALRLTGSYDSTANPSVGFQAEWNIDIARNWTLSLLGGIERSPQWNGASAWSSVTYRF